MIKTALTLFTALALFAAPTHAESPAVGPVVGQAAPVFTGTDSNGVTHTLSDFIGKTVVLEWTNHECPFVRKFYDAGVMQQMQRDAAANDIVWLTVNSGAEGKQGHTTPEQANALIAKEGSAEAARILDTDGTIGRMYNASTTPEMFVIDAQGILVFAGGIDDKPSASADSLEGATNYVQAALANLAAGEPVAVGSAKPYGCSVKY